MSTKKTKKHAPKRKPAGRPRHDEVLPMPPVKKDKKPLPPLPQPPATTSKLVASLNQTAVDPRQRLKAHQFGFTLARNLSTGSVKLKALSVLVKPARRIVRKALARMGRPDLAAIR